MHRSPSSPWVPFSRAQKRHPEHTGAEVLASCALPWEKQRETKVQCVIL